ncbi:hypothetical protein VIRA109638_04120 [Vibrio rarus]
MIDGIQSSQDEFRERITYGDAGLTTDGLFFSGGEPR